MGESSVEEVSPKIVIYHIEGRRSSRVVWLCEELELPYELVFKRGDIMGSMATIREVYPDMPMAPVVSIDGTFMVESGAILEVLTARYGNGALVPPVNSIDFLYHAQWMHFAEGTAMARLGMDFFTAMNKGVAVDELPVGYRSGDDIAAFAMVGSVGVFDFADRYLEDHAFFGGAEFTTADIMMQWFVPLARLMVAIDVDSYSHIRRWRKVVESRPAFKRATQACTPSGVNEFGMPADQPLIVQPLSDERLRKSRSS